MHSHTQEFEWIFTIEESLNPCCNGRCTRTRLIRQRTQDTGQVLILVVMEDALAQAITYLTAKAVGVLILVVMEDALAPTTASEVKTQVLDRLNPCCNGRCTRTC